MMERLQRISTDSFTQPVQLSVERRHMRGTESLCMESELAPPARLNHTRSSSESVRSKELKNKWKFAARKLAPDVMPDPWEQFNISNLPVQNCIRHRYSSIRQKWSEDRVQIKMHPECFARGAMRECYRVKKLSVFDKNDNWAHAHNYVAKKYIRPVEKQTVFEDVRLQMDSKLWAEEFNRHNPPKKIDIMQMVVLELIDEHDRPLYHLEHFIEGDYVKYNSNSGFVEDMARKTPQAFSHFTFERSGHQMIVVDIQGVGDLYTDPQVHTASGDGYGDGNLGTKGMALFFHSHLCNEICYSMCLTEFDLSDTELQAVTNGETMEQDGSTHFTNSDSLDVCEPLTTDDDDSAMERLRCRTISMGSAGMVVHSSVSMSSFDGSLGTAHDDNCVCEQCVRSVMAGQIRTSSVSRHRSDTESVSIHTDAMDEDVRGSSRLQRCVSVESTSSYGSSRHTREAEKEAFWNETRKLSRPACVLSDTEIRQLSELSRLTHTNSVLGQVHLDLARYHELGRFLPKSVSECRGNSLLFTVENTGATETPAFVYDEDSALFHLDAARRCGILEATITIAQMAYEMPHELLKDVKNADYWNCPDPEDLGFEMMESAAGMGDRSAMLSVAESYETGRRLGRSRSPRWPKAVEWYSKAADLLEDPHEGTEGCLTQFEIFAKMATMYKEGGFGLEQNFTRAYELFTEAAEIAMEAMRGKLATRFYEMAEQCAV